MIPVLNVPRKKLRLRTEIVFWLQDAAKLDLKLLICKDQVNWGQLKQSEWIQWGSFYFVLLLLLLTIMLIILGSEEGSQEYSLGV